MNEIKRTTRASGTVLLFVMALVSLTLATVTHAQNLPLATPETVGMDGDRLAGIEALVQEGIEQGKLPGCTVCIGRQGKIIYHEAFGLRKLAPSPEPMTKDTIFDMASLTKPIATATSIMRLIDDGQLGLGDRVIKFFPKFGAIGKDKITIKDLLLHQSGLIPDNALKDYENGPEHAWQKICELDLVCEVGSTFKYSDVNFIVLAKIIEKITGSDLHQYSQETIFKPLGMSETGFLPSPDLRKRAAPTERRDGQWMRGEVHDPRAFRLDGVAGHAGLFSSANDLAIYANMMLGRGTFRYDNREHRILSPQAVAAMTQAYPVSSGTRGLGWDKQTGYSSNRGDLLSRSAFGHGGFTGTVVWIDPELDLFIIFLSNRLHPHGKGSVNQLAGKIANLVASSIQNPPGKRPKGWTNTFTGIDVLAHEGFRQLRDQRIGLITNQTGRSVDGQSTIEIFHHSPNVQLTTLFSPEHGIAGQLDVAAIGDSEEASTGIRIFSLYGKTRRPTAQMLTDVDTLVFDIQDIGTRFYTYLSTMGEAMKAAAEHGKRFVVLDRPNPIGGTIVTGPLLDPGKESFVSYHQLPVRHGMTVGEVATLFKTEWKLDLDLCIVKCEGWTRDMFWDSTNLTWVNPSPNMRSLTQAILYPGVGLLEMTNVSVGRGTDTPFEVLGAPWVDGRHLAAKLVLAGATAVPIEFTPESSKYAGQKCYGIHLIVNNRELVEPVRIGLEIAHALRAIHPEHWETKGLNRLLGNDRVCNSILTGDPVELTIRLANEGMPLFLARRKQHLLY